MRNTFRILFYIKRNSLLRNGKAPVMARITINGERIQLSTQQAVTPSRWDTAAGRAAGRSEESQRINGALELMRARIARCYDRLVASGEPPTSLRVKELYSDDGGRQQMLLAFFRAHNDEFRSMVGVSRSVNTYNKYRSVYLHLSRFVAERYGCDDVPFYRLDRRFVTDFHGYIRRTAHRKPNTVWVYMIALKHILMLARNQGYMARDIFCNYKLRHETVTRNYLSLEEIRRVESLPLDSQSLRFVRDMFLFSCFTGLSYIDMRNLRFDNVQCMGREKWINTSRCKTGTAVSVRLFDLPQTIIERHASAGDGGRIFRMPSNGWCNMCLRRVMRAAGIERRITFHSARHTFATSITLSQGVAIETISKLLGHKNIRTTQIYASVTHTQLRREMSLLSKRMCRRPCVS